MATSRNTKSKNTETPEQVKARVTASILSLIGAVTRTDKAGSDAIAVAKSEAFHASIDALSALGAAIVSDVAPFMTNALTGENVAKLFTDKDGALYIADSDDRAVFKSATNLTRALRVFRFDSATNRALFVNGPATLANRCVALVGVEGHSENVTRYYEWLGAMNASVIAQTKAIPATALAKWRIFTDDSTGETVYAKAIAVASDPKSTNAVAKFMSDKRETWQEYAATAPFNVDVPADKLEAFTKYVVARYLLSLDATPAAPAAPEVLTVTVS